MLCHVVPRLDAPDRFGLLPAPQAKWLGAGLFSGPVAGQALAYWWHVPLAALWGIWWLWALWLVTFALCIIGAFWRPGGLHVGQWALVRLDYALLPKRAVWRPVGRGVLWW